MKPSASSAAKSAIRPLPVVVYFEADVIGRNALKGTQRYRRVAFEKLQGPPEAECILITSSERLLRERHIALRWPHLRVLALSDDRFNDPRADGMVYAYLPVNTPTTLLERMVDNALDHIHLLSTRRDAQERLADATREISDVNYMGAALLAERHPEKLLELFLSKSRAITHADAGAVYVVEETAGAAAKRKSLRRALAQCDRLSLSPDPKLIPMETNSIVGYAAVTGEAVKIDQSSQLPAEAPYAVAPVFDEEPDYQAQAVLAVPMRTPKGEIVGVLQLLNPKQDAAATLTGPEEFAAQVTTFTRRQLELVSSLASQAAVAYESGRFYQAIQAVFEGLVRALRATVARS